ncbi:MAG TPA: DNA-binding domain-containing protein [Polaromonas sp.]|uniref:DNA-binding domain-containing protein n=1 Tax=Polaromonas sp. TaxID=1869339 RepID=UPI002D5B239E|nr:DNA-binding domain-containing protein [Polaromonas sp.]HYW55494.1 DNA-binding domain-containing protein [Polaromonas sp.]
MSQQVSNSPEQLALLQAVLGAGDDSPLSPLFARGSAQQEQLWQRGLQAYRANGQALAERVLLGAYPVLAQLMGDESFAMLARHFWAEHPPLRGDMACWGDGLADFIDAALQLSDNPYLGDVARLEWLMHQAASAADVDADLASFALLTSADPALVTLTLGAGVALLASGYPVVSVVNAHLLGSPTLAHAGQLLQEAHAEKALVWRQGFKPCTRAVSTGEYMVLRQLMAGQSLLQALEATDATPTFIQSEALPFDFSGWLGDAVRNGLICGARSIPITKGEEG